MTETEPDCICGHELWDHHVSWLPYDAGARLVEECEHLDEDALPWDERCNHYRPMEAV